AQSCRLSEPCRFGLLGYKIEFFNTCTLCIASSTFLPGFIPSSLHIKTPKGQRAVLALWCGIGKHKKENGNVIGCT
ncbi:MAG: hypothetical protein WAW64_04330, partial [Gemmiger qucibialis]